MNREDREQLLDALLEEALKLSMTEEAEDFEPGQTELPFEPSEEHKKWMEDFLARQRKAKRKAARRKNSVRAAAILAAGLCGATLFISNVEAAREPVERFITEVKSRYTSMIVVEEPENNGDDQVYYEIPDDLEDLYVLDYVPWGYRFEKLFVSLDSYTTVYSTKHDKNITLKQILIAKSYDFDTEGVEMEKFTMGGETYYLTVKEEQVRITWTNGQYSFVFSGAIDEETAIKIVKNIKLKE